MRLVLAFAAYLVVAMATGRALGLGGEPVPIGPRLLAHGAGCAAFCLLALWLPPQARLWPARGVLAAPGLYAAFLLFWVPVTLFGYTWLLAQLRVAFPPQPHLAYFAGLTLDSWPSVGAWVTVVLIGPLAEELAFRGYARDLFGHALGARAGLWLTAVLFGLFHGITFGLPLALLGWLFGALRERYASLAPAFVAHALHNGLTVGITMAWPQILDQIYR